MYTGWIHRVGMLRILAVETCTQSHKREDEFFGAVGCVSQTGSAQKVRTDSVENRYCSYKKSNVPKTVLL